MIYKRTGKMAKEVLGLRLELVVMESAAGFYLGTFDDEGPVSRESAEYYPTKEIAQRALDENSFTQTWEAK